jgi:hypothetical protein
MRCIATRLEVPFKSNPFARSKRGVCSRFFDLERQLSNRSRRG